MVENKITGSCLCGTVKYRITGNLNKFYYCHCMQCRKITGSAHASNILTDPNNIEWVSGKNNIKRFDLPGNGKYVKNFCRTCGSGVPFINKSGDTLFIPAGSLDVDPRIRTTNNIFWDDRALWYEEGLSAPRCVGFPE